MVLLGEQLTHGFLPTTERAHMIPQGKVNRHIQSLLDFRQVNIKSLKSGGGKVESVSSIKDRVTDSVNTHRELHIELEEKLKVHKALHEGMQNEVVRYDGSLLNASKREIRQAIETLLTSHDWLPEVLQANKADHSTVIYKKNKKYL
ncbi:MAG: hypothetical protein WAV40_04510 [Microgenomates group bacterium]